MKYPRLGLVALLALAMSVAAISKCELFLREKIYDEAHPHWLTISGSRTNQVMTNNPLITLPSLPQVAQVTQIRLITVQDSHIYTNTPENSYVWARLNQTSLNEISNLVWHIVHDKL